MRIGKFVIAWPMDKNKYHCVNIPLSRHKNLEIQIETDKSSTDLGTRKVFYNFVWKTQTDHAGMRFECGIRNLFWANLSFYDSRHWNSETNDWEKY
jgi:hypothetical protein